MNELFTFTDFAILEPRYFIERITSEIDKRDVEELTGGNRGSVRVSADHPAIEAVRLVVNRGQGDVRDTVGEVIPSIAVSEARESEAVHTKGDSIVKAFLFTAEMVATLKSMPIDERTLSTIISNRQIIQLENLLTTYPGGVAARMNAYRLPSMTNVGLWCRTAGEAELLHPILRSILYGSKLDMLRRGATKITFTCNRGIYMAEFDIYGDEFTISYVNQFRNITVFDAPGDLNMLAADADVDIVGEYKTAGTNEQYIPWPK